MNPTLAALQHESVSAQEVPGMFHNHSALDCAHPFLTIFLSSVHRVSLPMTTLQMNPCYKTIC